MNDSLGSNGAKPSGAVAPEKRSAQSPGGDNGHVQRVLGDYRLIRELGRGGMGIVYEALQISLDKRVALKVLPFAGAFDARSLRRFQNEARAAAQLQHPHIVPVTFIGSDRGVHYYVMQYIEGLNLSQVIRGLKQQAAAERRQGEPTTRAIASDEPSREPSSELSKDSTKSESCNNSPLSDRSLNEDSEITEVSPGRRVAAVSREPLRDTSDLLGVGTTKRSSESPEFFLACAKLAANVADALQHAHDSGVVHRDIKPSNLMLDRHGDVWVTDFGLAQVAGAPGVTLTGDVIGTLRYMSPEQALAKRVVIDHRTDIYSLGATLYELTTLQHVFDGQSSDELLRQIAFTEPTKPRKVNPRMPKDLETIVLKALEKNPDERYQTAVDLARDLKAFHDDLPIGIRPPTLVHRSRKWLRKHRGVAWTLAAAALLVFIVSLVSTAIVWQALGKTTLALVKEKEALKEKQQQLTLSEGGRLLAQSEHERADDPALGQQLAIVGATMRPGAVANQALTAANEELHEVWTIIGSHSPAPGGAYFSPNGQKAVTFSRIGLGESEPAKIWDIPSRKLLKRLDDGTRITSAIFSPDGGRVLTVAGVAKAANGDRLRGTLEHLPPALWDAVTGEKLHTLSEAKLTEAHARAFDRSGKRLVAPADKNSAIVYDAINGQPFLRLQGHEKAVVFAAYDPSGRYIGTISADRKARVFDAESGKTLCVCDFSDDGVAEENWRCSLVFSVDGTLLLTGTTSRGAQIWDIASGKPLDIDLGLDDQIRFSPGGERVYVYSRQGALQARDSHNGDLLYSLGGGSRGLTLFEESPDGRHLLISFGEDRIALIEAASGRTASELRGHDGVVRSASFSADGRRVISSADDATVRIWNVESGARRNHFATNLADATRPQVAFSPDSKKLLALTRGADGAWLWNIENRERVAAWPGRPLVRGPVHERPITVDGERLHVWDTASRASAATLVSDRGPFRGAVLSPGGEWIAAIVEGGPVWLWNWKNGLRLELPGHREAVSSVAFSPDGRFVATASADRRVRVFDAQTRELKAELLHDTKVDSVQFGPAGDRLLTADVNGQAILWDWEKKETTAKIADSERQDFVALFSRDGQRVFTYDAFENRTVRCWSATSGELLRQCDAADGIVALAENPVKTELLIGSNVSGAILWNYESDEERRVTAQGVSSVAFAHTGARFAVTLSAPIVAPEYAPLGAPLSNWGGATIEIYSADDAPQPTLQTTLPTSGGEIRSLRFALGDSSLLFYARSYGGALFNVATNAELFRFSGHSAPIAHAAFTPDGARFVTASWDRTAIVWNAKDGALLRRFEGHEAPLIHCAIDSQGATLATASADNTCRLWRLGFIDSKDEEAPRVLRGHADQVWRVAFSADDERLLSISRDKSVRVWDRKSLQSTAIEEAGRLIPYAEFAPDGGRILIAPGYDLRVEPIGGPGGPPVSFSPVLPGAGDGSYDVKLLGALGAAPIELPHDRPARAARFSPDGAKVLTVTDDGRALLWRASDGKKLRTLQLPGASIRWATFSFDGESLLTDHESRVALWSVDSGERLLVLESADDFAFGTDWPLRQPYEPLSRDGKWLAAVSRLGELRKWSLDPLALARAIAPRRLTAAERKEFEITTSHATGADRRPAEREPRAKPRR